MTCFDNGEGIGCKGNKKCLKIKILGNGPFARYANLLDAHPPEMPGTFSPPPGVSNPDMHNGTCVTWCMPGSLTIGFPWSRRRGKRSRHSRRMRNPQYHVSGKRPMIKVFCLPRFRKDISIGDFLYHMIYISWLILNRYQRIMQLPLNHPFWIT